MADDSPAHTTSHAATELSSKKRSRLESKKKKAAAFLELVNKNKQEDEHKMECEDSGEPPPKKTREINHGEEKTASDDGENPFQMPPDELERFRKLMRERQKAAMQKPKLFLTLESMAAYNSPYDDNPQLPPLFLADLQHLILYGLQGNTASFKPRWCRLLRVGKVTGVVVIVVDSVGCQDFEQHAACFPRLSALFNVSVEMITPAQYDSSVADDMFRVPLSKSQLMMTDMPVEKKKELKAAMGTGPYETVGKLKFEEKVPRTHLLLNFGQLLQENYPLPVQLLMSPYKDFVFTSDSYSKVKPDSPMFSIDCEMCLTKAHVNELCRVSVVNEKLEIVYDTLVKPYNKIINYLTRYSGITKFMLDPVTTRLGDVHRKLREILPPDAILCGQSLNCDLIALKMFHPYIIDTSVIYNLTGERRMKTGLRRLAAHFLGRSIQENEAAGHCSVEDASACMELVLLKLKNGMAFGDVILGGEMEMDSLPIHNDSAKSPGIQHDSFNLEQSEIKQTNNDSKNEMNQIENDSDIDRGNEDAEKLKNIKNSGAFFQRIGDFLTQNLFKLLQENNKKSVVIGNENAPISSHVDDSVTRMFSSDKECQKAAKVEIQENDFVYVHLTGYRDCLWQNPSEKEKLKALWKLDKRLSGILKHVKSKTVVSVVLSGRKNEKDVQNAKTFVKIT